MFAGLETKKFKAYYHENQINDLFLKQRKVVSIMKLKKIMTGTILSRSIFYISRTNF